MNKNNQNIIYWLRYAYHSFQISSHNIQAYILYRGKQINIYYLFSENYQLTNYVGI